MFSASIASFVCPIDNRYPISIFVESVPGDNNVLSMSWQCANDITHNGVLTLVRTIDPIGTEGGAVVPLPVGSRPPASPPLVWPLPPQYPPPAPIDPANETFPTV